MHDVCLLLHMSDDVVPTGRFMPVLSECTFSFKCFCIFFFSFMFKTFVLGFVSILSPFLNFCYTGLALWYLMWSCVLIHWGQNMCCSLFQLQYLPPPWGDCKSTPIDSDYFSTYSITACRIDCETRYLLENCNCRMVHMPGMNWELLDQ